MNLFLLQKIVFIQFFKCRQIIQKMGLNINNTGRGIILFEAKKVNIWNWYELLVIDMYNDKMQIHISE